MSCCLTTEESQAIHRLDSSQRQKLSGFRMTTHGLCSTLFMFLGVSIKSKQTKRRIMKHKYFILTTIIIIAGTIFVGCNNNREEDTAESVKQANEDLQDAKVQYENEWEQFKSNVEAAITKNEERIEVLKKEMKSTSNEFKAKYENKILTLEQKNIELKKKLNEYKYDGEKDWQEFKQEFSNDIDTLENALNEIFEKK